MTVYLTLLGRYALTLGAVAAAALLAFILWKQEAQTPWTRDGRVRADVVQIAPDVSGPVASVAVKDNQWVNRGDVLYSIDPRWLKLAVSSAQAEVEARRQEMAMRQDAARRRAQIQGFWVVGYFEETRLRHIHVGDTAHITLMGYDPVITGHVESIGHGIGDTNDETGALGLPEVEPTFSWVRLAQRVPVRIHIDTLPEGVERVAGLSATVSVIPARLARRAGKSSPAGANQAQ